MCWPKRERAQAHGRTAKTGRRTCCGGWTFTAPRCWPPDYWSTTATAPCRRRSTLSSNRAAAAGRRFTITSGGCGRGPIIPPSSNWPDFRTRHRGHEPPLPAETIDNRPFRVPGRLPQMIGKKLHEFDLQLCEHVLANIRGHRHVPGFAAFIEEQLDPPMMAYLKALDGDVEPPPLLLNDAELEDL